MATPPFRVFYSYSHADVRLVDRLRTHLAMLRRHGLITEWYDRDIEAGALWREEIARELQAADVVLLFVSADFLASDFCYEEEMTSAIERAERGDMTVIGVMLRPADGWEGTPFARFQLVPENAKPITTWPNADQAYSEVASSIRRALEARVRSSSLPGVPYGGDMPRAAALSTSSDAAARGLEIANVLEQRERSEAAPYFIVVTGGSGSYSNYYTQCFREEKSFWCEAVSNKFLDAPHQLGADQTARLAAFGWNPPENELENWWCVQEDPRDVAALMVRTLSEVYGVSLGVPLQLNSATL